MDAVDATVLVLLAMADFSLIAYLRLHRNRKMRLRRMYRSLLLAVRRELVSGPPSRKIPVRRRQAAATAMKPSIFRPADLTRLSVQL
jgi:hypothetical protein